MERKRVNWLKATGLGILGLVFAGAGALKITLSAEFAAQIAAYRLLPDRIVPALALSLPVLEVILGAVLLVPGRFRRAGLLGMSLLLATFLGALFWAYSKGLNIDCGCFGSLKMPVPVAIIRNLMLLAVSGLLLQREYNRATTPHHAASTPAAKVP